MPQLPPLSRDPVSQHELQTLLTEVFQNPDITLEYDACCWTIDGKPPYRGLEMLSDVVSVAGRPTVYSIYATRVLRDEEFQGDTCTTYWEGDCPPVSPMKMLSVIAQPWTATPDSLRYWRSGTSIGTHLASWRTLNLVPMEAAPADFQWQVQIRELVYTTAPPRRKPTKLDFEQKE